MNRVEEVLLERMTVRRWCVAVITGAMLFGSGGYLAGRQQVKPPAQAGAAPVVAELDKLEAWGKRYTAEKAKQRSDAANREGGR